MAKVQQGGKKARLETKISALQEQMSKAMEELAKAEKREKDDWVKRATTMIGRFYPEPIETLETILASRLGKSYNKPAPVTPAPGPAVSAA